MQICRLPAGGPLESTSNKSTAKETREFRAVDEIKLSLLFPRRKP